MTIPMRRSVLGAVGLICLASTGCMQVPVCLPEFASVPAVNTGASKAELHAFRVDVTQTVQVKEGPAPNYNVKGENFENYELTAIKLGTDGTTPALVAFSTATGWRYVGFWNYWASLTSHSIAVRLYRPGFETIDLKPHSPAGELHWHETVGLAAQEKAVDDLLGVSPVERLDPKSTAQQRRLAPATTSAGHRDALLFAAREYERLARSAVPEMDEPVVRARLMDKAGILKALAK